MSALSSLDSPRPLPTANVLEALRDAIDEAAERCALSQRKRQIYGTWIFGFVCWCLRNPPNRVTPDRIESFRRNLRDDSSADPIDQQRALDALAFFFGEVDVDNLGIETSRPSLNDPDEDLPFVYYNQMSASDASPMSPLQDSADEGRTASSDLSSPGRSPDLESPEPA
jgi:hypothetical protein